MNGSEHCAQTLSFYAKDHPAQAAEIHDSEFETRDRDAMKAIAGSWVGKDPPAAAAWVDSLPEDENKSAVQWSFLETWADRDPQAASTWVAAQPADAAGRDSLIGILTSKLLHVDPEAALHWSAEIEHPAQGPSLMLGAAKEWVQQDPVAAKEALASGELPEAARKVLAEQFAGKVD